MIRRRWVLHPRYIFRDAETGRFVTRLYALLNPKTTVAERIMRHYVANAPTCLRTSPLVMADASVWEAGRD